jgi:hypothetical protein
MKVPKLSEWIYRPRCTVRTVYSLHSDSLGALYVVNACKGKVKLSHCRPGQALRAPGGWEFLDNRYIKVVRFLALRTGRLCSPGYTPDAAGRMKSTKNPNEPIGNRTRYLPQYKLKNPTSRQEFFFTWWRAPQQMLRTHHSLKAFCATLWWRWAVFFTKFYN